MCAKIQSGLRLQRSNLAEFICRQSCHSAWVDFPPAVNRLIGLWWLAKIFYPDRFPEDIKALVRDFYTAFYHVTPTAAQIERVLAGG